MKQTPAINNSIHASTTLAINNSVRAITGETPLYVSGLRHPRTQLCLCASRSFVGKALTTPGENAKEINGFANVMAETCSGESVSVAVVTTQVIVKSESRHTLPVPRSNSNALLFAVTTHARPRGGVIGGMFA